MAVKDASHVFGWANMWKPLNELRPHFACELCGSGSHGFCFCFGEAKQDGRHRWETQFSSREHLGFSGGHSPPKHIYSLVDAAAANSLSSQREDTGMAGRTAQSSHRKGPAQQGDLNPSFLRDHSHPNYPEWNEIVTWRCYKTNLSFNALFLTEKM